MPEQDRTPAKIAANDADLARLARRAAAYAGQGEKVPQCLLDDIASSKKFRDELRGRS